MTDAIQIAIITAFPPTMVATAGLVLGILNRTSGDRIEKKVESVEGNTNAIAKKVDGHTDLLVKVEKKLSFAAGKKAGKAAK